MAALGRTVEFPHPQQLSSAGDELQGQRPNIQCRRTGPSALPRRRLIGRWRGSFATVLIVHFTPGVGPCYQRIDQISGVAPRREAGAALRQVLALRTE